MAQITHGLRAILSNPTIYSAFQSLMGADRLRRNFVARYVRPFAGMRILDVGCGPADILAYLPDIQYRGYDISEAYIARARDRFGQRGSFHCKQLQLADLDALPHFDVVLALGLIHHLDDEIAIELIQLAHRALKPGGRMLTMDPCLDPTQNACARYLVRHDRGQNVRDEPGYRALANTVFTAPHVEVRHQVWIPYTHCYMECRK